MHRCQRDWNLHQQGRYAERKLDDYHHADQLEASVYRWIIESPTAFDIPAEKQYS